MRPLINPDAYAAHAHLVAPARDKPQLWRLLVGLLVMGAVYLALNQTLFSVLIQIAPRRSEGFFAALLDGSTPAAMLVLLFSFAGMSLSVFVAARLLQGRSAASLLGPWDRFAPQFMAVTVAVALLNAVIFVLPPYTWGAPFELNMAPSRWTLLLPLSLLGVFVQVSAEEIVFRGYLQSQLAARFNSPLIWMLVPAILFGAGHYSPETAGENAGIIAIWAVVFGLLMADLTARSGSLGPAIGIHFVNNVSAILIVSLPDELSGLALYLTPFSMADADSLRAWLPVDFALMILAWLAARVALRR